MKTITHKLVVDYNGPKIDDKDDMMKLLEEKNIHKENVLYLINLFNTVLSLCIDKASILEKFLKFIEINIKTKKL